MPNDAPILDKPEWKGGTVPFDAPSIDKPEWQGGVVPNDAPVHYKPELIIEIPEPKKDKPNTPTQTPKPKEDPKVEEVKIVKSREKSRENHAKSKSEETVEAYSAPATLPKTGAEFGIAISLLGMLGLSLGAFGIAATKKEN